jgi:IS4 transposase
MQAHPTLFSQITRNLYAEEFSRLTLRFPTAKPPRGLSEYDHFLAMCFGQLTYRESLRDIVGCLNSKPKLLYHLGFRGRVTRTNLAYANKHRNWRLFQSIAQTLMRRAARLYQTETADPELPRLAFALDSSIISLALNLHPWGYYARTRQAAVKLHLMLSLKGNLPAWAVVTDSKMADLRMLDEIPIIPAAHYVMDRGYMDFVRLYRLHKAGAFFVVRCKEPVSFTVLERRSVDGSITLKCDQTVKLKSNWSKKSFPEPLRKIRVFDPENQVMLVLLTNNFLLPAQVIALLYQHRWRVELFFKWIKQHLRLRAFYGRSENAVRCQVWCAICAYLLVAILKKQLALSKSLNEILQICSVNIFEQAPAYEILTAQADENPLTGDRFDFQKCFDFKHL